MFRNESLFNLNNANQECDEIVNQLAVFDTTCSNVLSQSTVSEENVLICTTPIAGQLWSLLGGLISDNRVSPLTIEYVYNKKDVTGYPTGSKRPDECVYIGDYLICKGEHEDVLLSEAEQDLLDKMPDYNTVQCGSRIRYLPVYASCKNYLSFHLLNLQKFTLHRIGNYKLSRPDERARATIVSLNIFRYFRTIQPFIPLRTLPLFAVKDKITYMHDHVLKKRQVTDTCPLELYEFLQVGCIPWAVKIINKKKIESATPNNLKLSPKGLRISSDADIVDSLGEFKIALKCILLCISDLHKKNFNHRDLRWCNIIKINQDDKPRFVLIDFEQAEEEGTEINIPNYILHNICQTGHQFCFYHDLKSIAQLMKVYWESKGVTLDSNGQNLFQLLQSATSADANNVWAEHPFVVDAFTTYFNSSNSSHIR
jgi:hypothetical protein